jgi:SAM-dependent methyltransferase
MVLLSKSSLASKPPLPTLPMSPQKPDIGYIATPFEVVNAALALAKVNADDIVYDLGSGDGRLVIAAAQHQGACGIGIDIDPQRIQEAEENAKKAGVSDRVKFHQQDLFKSKFGEATVVFLYLLPHLNLKLRPELFRQLKPGTRIVSRDFDMGEWKPEQVIQITNIEEESTLFYWVVS